ncbi:protein FAM241B isoform X1 [Gopherus flavomarginatus]|uniref:protein FAM241B isoform X1 n=1 Tax=Gopherus flavomarginatus TaxID=286002 RepID=UPI0021CBE8DE|nr:protein FAM241B isoform X1 [Gopherus flavomarginatus]
MVQILANGDIVQDDDPRVRANAQHRENTSRQEFFNMAPNAGHAPLQQRAARPRGHSPFSELNQQLVNMGFPLWNLGNQVVEPVMSILLLFLLMMGGRASERDSDRDGTSTLGAPHCELE